MLENGADINLHDEFGHVCHDDIDKCSQLIQLFAEYGYNGSFIDLIDDDVEEGKRGVRENQVEPQA